MSYCRAIWGCGCVGNVLETLVAMSSDPDIIKIELVRFYDDWEFYFETVEGIDARQKARFYWEEFDSLGPQSSAA